MKLGRDTVPWPYCIADPNLGLSCQTLMDDQIFDAMLASLDVADDSAALADLAALPRRITT